MGTSSVGEIWWWRVFNKLAAEYPFHKRRNDTTTDRFSKPGADDIVSTDVSPYVFGLSRYMSLQV